MNSAQVGNLIITFTDRYQSKFYLTTQLQFTKNLTEAGLFYLLKSDETPICSGDRVSINTSNKVLVITDDTKGGATGGPDAKQKILLIDRNIAHRYSTTEFIIRDQKQSDQPIDFHSKLFFIIDEEQKLALRFYYSLSLGNEDNDIPILTYGSYDEGREIGIDIFQFSFLDARTVTTIGGPGGYGGSAASGFTTASGGKLQQTEDSAAVSRGLDNYKGILLIIILLVILAIFLMINEKMRALNV